ncbi:hypothetical protein [Paracoccus kondratievae]|uniref:Uncharacterized protein n=1 Tax=Paracoccus kondratievae TaxID=135740 RepID=A0AAD3P0Z9_9RHOB|nr:hypothetical protein [Paracoccus kondratievae]GLK65665.1 hypothetical protein GCM10017635_31420 [Paracoccus kondratievae]
MTTATQDKLNDTPPDYPGFVPSAEEAALFDGMVAGVDAFATTLAMRFEDAGSDPMVGASLVANLLVGAAWKLAAVTRIIDGGTPDPANFVGLATDITTRARFDTEAIRSAMAEIEGGASV